MQLMCRFSEENDTECLGIFDEPVKKFVAGRSGMKIPQIGWNRVVETCSPIFTDIPDGSYFYFVHSYYAAKGAHTIGVSDYIHPYSAALHKDNFYGVQFHPEKSAAAGEQLLRNFLSL
jgi:glutamine amidotransferase